MTKNIRLIQILHYFRSRTPPVRAEDLAEEFGMSVRSIYRDIDALRASGAVIDGEAGFGFTLTEDPALPPMMFSTDEMEALVLGLREVISVGDPVLIEAAKGALGKLKACLPTHMANQFEHGVLHARRFHTRPTISINLPCLRSATRNENAIEINYKDADEKLSKRKVLPLSIVFMDQTLMLLAWCKLRNDYRAFRIDRIISMKVTTESFRPKRVSMLREFHKKLDRNSKTS